MTRWVLLSSSKMACWCNCSRPLDLASFGRFVSDPVCSGIVAGLVSLIILTITGNPLDGYVPAVNVSVFVNFLTVALMCVFAPGPSREKEEQLDVPQIRTSVTNPPPWRSGKTGKSWFLPQIYIQISQKPDGFFKWIFHGLDDRWW